MRDSRCISKRPRVELSVKACKLDDSWLKGNLNYPWELVHWLED